ncbi:flavodoxin family protein [Paludicola sp. MB14-C6]|uniref:flavodoxin family protein n=1 Tax=Paludihabitans sp. MB14-C6 TaxID=3070656 RepID=UPI0027DD44AB|nr:flavodoxin family protein [Paludicola sp. MB14-C6]WMJ23280.1 flavodoxin family protein [Paludicola sp. MB14-C6]
MNIVMPNANKAVILFASPHKKGNTAKLLESFLKQFCFEYQIINLYNCSIKPCIDCKACINTTCPYNLDDMGIIIKRIEESNIIICASPIYFNHVPAPFKAMMDRCQQFYLNKMVSRKNQFEKGRIGILLTTAGCNNKKISNDIYDVFQMFFRCFETSFIEHIAVLDTDQTNDFSISQKQIDHIKKYIS